MSGVRAERRPALICWQEWGNGFLPFTAAWVEPHDPEETEDYRVVQFCRTFAEARRLAQEKNQRLGFAG